MQRLTGASPFVAQGAKLVAFLSFSFFFFFFFSSILFSLACGAAAPSSRALGKGPEDHLETLSELGHPWQGHSSGGDSCGPGELFILLQIPSSAARKAIISRSCRTALKFALLERRASASCQRWIPRVTLCSRRPSQRMTALSTSSERKGSSCRPQSEERDFLLFDFVDKDERS